MDCTPVDEPEDVVDAEKTSDRDSAPKYQKLEDVERSNKCYKAPGGNLRKPKYKYTMAQFLALQSCPASVIPPPLKSNLKGLLMSSTKEKDEENGKKNHSVTFALEPKILTKKHAARDTGDKMDKKKNAFNMNHDKAASNKDGFDDNFQKKINDPKERVRKEQDICLSPQRKSFTTGCFIQTNSRNTDSSASNSNKSNGGTENRDDSSKKTLVKNARSGNDVGRRISSGRTIIREQKTDTLRSDGAHTHSYNEFAPNRAFASNREIPTVVYERKFTNHSFDRDKTSWESRSKMSNNYEKRNRNQSHREEAEPEWMTDGPTSQHDTIELRGFDDDIVKEKHSKGNKNKIGTRVFTNSTNNGNTANASSAAVVGPNKEKAANSKSPPFPVQSKTFTSNSSSHESELESTPEPPATTPQVVPTSRKSPVEDVFSLDDILRTENFPDLSMIEFDGSESAGSRFTKWFKHDEFSATTYSDKKEDATKNDEIHSTVASATKEDDIKITSSFFSSSCMSKDWPFQNAETKSTTSTNNVMDFIQASQDTSANNSEPSTNGRLYSVEEIEARFRGTRVAKMKPHKTKKEENESEVFKKLLSQAVSSQSNSKPSSSNPSEKNIAENATTNEKPIHSTISSEATDKPASNKLVSGLTAQQEPNHVVGSSKPNSPAPAIEMSKIFQHQQNKQQQELFSKMLMSHNTNNYTPQAQVCPRPMAPNASYIPQEIQLLINSIHPTRELMHRQDTINILKALRNGEVSQFQLIEQFKKTTAKQSKFRESVLCVLKLIQQQNLSPAIVLAGQPMGIPFNVPTVQPLPPQQQPYNENIIQQMMYNTHRINGPHSLPPPTAVYYKEFPGYNPPNYQNNTFKKQVPDQPPNQNVQRMTPTSSAVNHSETMSSNAMESNQDERSQKTNHTPHGPSKSVLLKMIDEKENVEKCSKDSTIRDNSTFYSNSNPNSQQNLNSNFSQPVPNVAAWNANKQPGVVPKVPGFQHEQDLNAQIQRLMNHNANRRMTEMTTPFANFRGSMSPNVNGMPSPAMDEQTAAQLNRWFSGDYASGGRQPTGPNFLSVEELERQQAVRN